SAVALYVAHGPGKSSGHVSNVLGVLDSRGKPIVGQDGADAMPRQALADIGISPKEAFVSHDPCPAMDKGDDGEVLLVFGQEQVEFVANWIGVRAVEIDLIANGPNFVNLTIERCRRLNVGPDLAI